ncbi:hypothetical protein FACS1894186_8200 [Alphaproteobacteria bacterium]|nr:hypothetical protein FACS1894186_8200 [Alphaproteobacteria bacterium]
MRRPAFLLCVCLAIAACAAGTDARDPWEPVNRRVHSVNLAVANALISPVAKAYEFAVPQPVRRGISGFLANIAMPMTILNHGLQGEGQRLGRAAGRFMLNTSAGVLGIFDVASLAGLPRQDADFGQTLGVWGWRDSNFIVLPLLGPSTVRDATGMGIGWLADPVNTFWRRTGTTRGIDAFRLTYWGMNALDYAVIGRNLYSELGKSSIDFYAAMREYYLQYRAGSLGGKTYEFSMDEEE